MPKSASVDVKKIADLAMIKLTPERQAKYQKQFDSILQYVAKINEVKSSPTDYDYNTDMKNVLRDDVMTPSLSQDEALANRKKTARNGCFKISQVVK